MEHGLIHSIHYRPQASSVRVEVLQVSELAVSNAQRRDFVAPQRPRFDVLLLVTKGSTSHAVDFVPHRLTVGDVLWVHSGQVQEWGKLTEFDGQVVLFLADLLTPGATDLLHRTGAWTRTKWASGSYRPELATLVGMVSDLATDGSAGAVQASERMLEAMLLLLAGDSDHELASPDRRSSLYDRFLQLLDAQGSTHRSVDAFARMLGCTTKTLNLAVRAGSHRKAKQAIDQRLALEAQRLLAFRADLPVRAVAEALGFDDAANFSKFFQRVAGQSPGAFRRRFRTE